MSDATIPAVIAVASAPDGIQLEERKQLATQREDWGRQALQATWRRNLGIVQSGGLASCDIRYIIRRTVKTHKAPRCKFLTDGMSSPDICCADVGPRKRAKVATSCKLSPVAWFVIAAVDRQELGMCALGDGGMCT